jgi:type IV pilus assembly protein PilM
MKLDWKRTFKLELEERRVLALDIGSSAVKIVQMHKYNGGRAVTAAKIVEIAANEGNNNQREINTTRAICECLESTGVRTRMAVCGVSGPEVAVRYFKFPSLPPEEIEGAIMLEAAQVCPFNVDDGTVDYQLIPDGENNISGVLVAATNKLIKNKVQLAKNASLDCVLMDIEGLALLNCLNEYEKRKAGRTTAVLNVGDSFTTLAIMSDNGLPFIRDMAYAGDGIVEEIATENNVSTESIKKILSGDSMEAQLELRDSLERACERLIADVTETLRYYAAQERAAIVEKIFVCGGFSLVTGFVELLDKQLPATAVLWNPFDKMRCDPGRHCEDILAKRGPAMAVAAGLAMRTI